MTTPTQVPADLIAGDTWDWERELSDYPAGTWTAVWYFGNALGQFSVAAGVSGTKHTASVAAATTAARVPGRYRWRLAVSSGGTRYTVEEGWAEVLQDPATATNVDWRSSARVQLDNVESYLRDPNNLSAASYSIGGRALSRWSRAELLAEQSRLRMEVRSEDAAEDMAAGLGNPRRLYARFGRG